MSRALMIKKAAAAALAVCMICGVCGVMGAAADEVIELPIIPVIVERESNGFKYITKLDDSAEITGCTKESSDTLVIPAKIGGKTVASIAKGAFTETNSFDTVVIPVTVKKINKGAFNKADVKTVIIPPTTDDVPEDAFYTKGMYEAYKAYLQGLSGGDTGELELYGDEDVIKPVGDVLEIKCSENSAAASAADALGAKKTLMQGYTAETGDIDCNGNLNNRDLKQLQTYIASENSTLLTPSFDVSGDGVINNVDLKLLQRFLTGEEVEAY